MVGSVLQRGGTHQIKCYLHRTVKRLTLLCLHSCCTASILSRKVATWLANAHADEGQHARALIGP